MSFYNFKWGFKREAIWATSVITDPAHDAYKLGIMTGEQIHPTPVTDLTLSPPEVYTAESPSAEKNDMVVTGKYNFIAQNAVFLEWILGKSSTAGPVGGVYTHTLTTPTDGSLLPSFTTHLQMDGDAVAWNLQTIGLKASSVKILTRAVDFESMLVTMEVAAKRTDTSVITLTNPTALAATATTSTYAFNKLTRTFDSNPIAGLTSVEIDILAGTRPDFESTYDGASWDGNWAARLEENTTRTYLLKMQVVVEDDTFWTELLALGNTKDLVFKWIKTTDDYIEITCTDVFFLAHPIITRSGKKTIADISCRFLSMTVSVKDTIAGDADGGYGE